MAAPARTLLAEEQHDPRRRLRRWMVLGAAVAALLGAGLLVWLGAGWQDPTDVPDGPAAGDRPDPGTPGDVPEPGDREPDPAPDPDPPPDPGPEQPTQPEIRYSQEARSSWDVTRVSSGDVLNVRAGPGTSFPVRTTLSASAVAVESTGRIASVDGAVWREVMVPGAGTGWVHSHYLAPHRPGEPPTGPGTQPAPPSQLPSSLRGAEWSHVPTSQRVVALTFDAGANADGVASILQTLQATDTPATFFFTGRWVDNHPDLARTIARRYPVGNHSVTHPHFTQLTDAQVREEIRGAESAIRRVTGVSSKPFFRFPYGDRDARTIRLVNEEGYGSFRWTVDTLGWQGTSGGMTRTAVVERVVSTLRPGQIVLLHVGSHPTDRSTLDADALPRIIEELRARGYRFITLPEALQLAAG